MAANNFSTFLALCKKLKILVIGDLMLDQYLWGTIERISPEAPVPIVDIKDSEIRLGGAANAALNISSMGAKPVLCGIAGADRRGTDLMQLIDEQGFDSSLVFQFPTKKTTVKTRVIAQGQHVLRVDDEDRSPLGSSEMSELLNHLFNRITEFDAILFSDYDKGFLDETLIQMVTIHAQQHDIPVLVDPKFKNFSNYTDSTLFKPNLKELNDATNNRLDKHDLEGIAEAVGEFHEIMPHNHTLVTLGDNGMVLVDEDLNYIHIPAHKRKVMDVSGAGDTVISVAALAMAAGLTPLEAARYANLAGGLVCEEVGVIPITRERLKAEAETPLMRK